MHYPDYEDGVKEARRIMEEMFPKRFPKTDGERGYLYMIKKEPIGGDVYRIGKTREPSNRMAEHHETGWLPSIILAVGEFENAQAAETKIIADLTAEGRRIRGSGSTSTPRRRRGLRSSSRTET